MTKTSEPIVFFGSGPVAAESLKLLARDFAVEAVITKPRPPHHRGEVPVLSLAEELGLQVETTTNREDLSDLFARKHFTSRVGILIDFGIIVSRDVIDYFPMGIVNSHFSILPEWRGADPISFAVLSGQKQTGVSLMLLVEAMDEGPLIGYGEYDMPQGITTPELTDQLIDLSYVLIKHNLEAYLSGEAKPAPQSMTGREVSYSRKLTKEDGVIDWSKPAAQLEREVRAYIEWPKSHTNFNGLEVVVTKVRVVDASGSPGKMMVIDRSPVVCCGDKSLLIESVKPAGKKEMTGEAFLAGYKKYFIG